MTTSSTIPHVGLYAAHATACFAFGQRVPVVDVNVLRVLGRIFGETYKPDNRRATDPEYRAAWQDASREYQRRQFATPAGRTRHLAKQALADLKKGGSLTLTRRHHIESAGRIEDARAIIEARGDAWPEGEVTSR